MLKKMKKKIKDSVFQFHNNEEGDEAVELAVLFPIILLLVGFIIDRFIQYEGVTAVSTAANEAIRYAIVEEDTNTGLATVEEVLTDRLQSSSMGWCTGTENSSCVEWGDAISVTNDEAEFNSNKSKNLLYKIDDKGWCNGSYMKIGVRAHKSSIFPSYESFRHLLKEGGPVYHTHTYVITARIESNIKCE